MSCFIGLGMYYYYCCVESVLEMVFFEGGRFGFRCFGSSFIMVDVFEEDEEEEEEDSDFGKSFVG